MAMHLLVMHLFFGRRGVVRVLWLFDVTDTKKPERVRLGGIGDAAVRLLFWYALQLTDQHAKVG